LFPDQQEEICGAAGRGMVEGEPGESIQEIQPPGQLTSLITLGHWTRHPFHSHPLMRKLEASLLLGDHRPVLEESKVFFVLLGALLLRLCAVAM